MCLWPVSKVYLEDPPPKKKKKKKKKKEKEEEPKPNYILVDEHLNLQPIVSWHHSAMPPVFIRNPPRPSFPLPSTPYSSNTFVHIQALHNFQPHRTCRQPSCQLITNGLRSHLEHLHQLSFITYCCHITAAQKASINNSYTLTA